MVKQPFSSLLNHSNSSWFGSSCEGVNQVFWRKREKERKRTNTKRKKKNKKNDGFQRKMMERSSVVKLGPDRPVTVLDRIRCEPVLTSLTRGWTSVVRDWTGSVCRLTARYSLPSRNLAIPAKKRPLCGSNRWPHDLKTSALPPSHTIHLQ